MSPSSIGDQSITDDGDQSKTTQKNIEMSTSIELSTQPKRKFINDFQPTPNPTPNKIHTHDSS